MTLRWKHGAPKTAFVTGAASGLGRRIVQILLDHGATVAAFDLSFDQTARDALTRHPGGDSRLTLYDMDVSEFDSVAQGIDTAIAAHGAPDFVLNAAGINVPQAMADMAPDVFERVIRVNLTGSWNVAKAVTPHMLARAHLILIASLAGRVPNHGYSAYCASKFGVVGLGGVLELELAPQGIDVTTICPGAIRTPMVESENATGPALGIKLRDVGGFQELEPAVQNIMRGVARRQRTVIPSLRARLLELSTRFAPGIGFATTRRFVAKELSASPKR